MLPERNVAIRRVFASDDVRRQNPPVLPDFPRRIGISPPHFSLPNRPFDTRRRRTSFHAEAAPLGRGVACDAAGRAGSLRGPRRVFLCAESDLSAHRISCPTGISVLIANNLTVICGRIIKNTAKVPNFRLWSVSGIRTVESAFLTFGVRPHECQIGSGEEYRPAVRVKTFKSCLRFLVSASPNSSSRRKNWDAAAGESLLIRCIQSHRNAFRTAPSDTNAIYSVTYRLIFCRVATRHSSDAFAPIFLCFTHRGNSRGAHEHGTRHTYPRFL